MLHAMSQELSLHQRRRKPLDVELEGIPWWPVLLPLERENVQRVLVVGSNLRKDHPLFAQRIRQAARMGCAVSAINSVANRMKKTQ